MACMFLAYRLLLQIAGLELMGLWSLLLAAATIGKLADATGAGGLARFVAKSRAEGRDAGIYIHTVLMSTIILYSVVGVFAYLISIPFIERFVVPSLMIEARTLVPYAIVSGLLAGPVSATIASGLDGVHRADLRSVLVMVSYLVFAACVYIALPHFGIMAWVGALLLQQTVVIVGGWLLLARHISGLGMFPWRLSKTVLVETISYGLKLQLNALANLLSEPLAKFMLAHYGGLSAVALYELAMRFVTAFRGLIVQAVTPLIPEFAISFSDAKRFGQLLRRSLKLVALSTGLMFVTIVALSPMYSQFMLGAGQSDLIFFTIALAAGSALNTLSVPYYLAGIGCNVMRWNVASQIIMAACVLVLGGLFGEWFAATGVISGIVAGLVLGSIVVVVGNSRALRSSGRDNTTFRATG